MNVLYFASIAGPLKRWVGSGHRIVEQVGGCMEGMGRD